MANKNPVQTEGFLAQQQPKGDEAMGRTIGVRFPVDVDEALRAQGKLKGDLIRRYVEQGLQREGLL